jgi:peptide/nickel transport system permease protein
MTYRPPEALAELGLTGAKEVDHSIELTAGDGFWRSSLRRLLGQRVAVASIAAIAIFAILALAAPLITSGSPDLTNLNSTFAPPSAAHWLGTDELGRDVLTRLLYGIRVSLGVALAGVIMALVVGTAVGLVSGYLGGWVDEILMRIVDMLLSIPPLFLFILLGILIQPGVIALGAIIAFIFWTSTARLVRGEVLSLKKRDYILSARLLGVRTTRLLFRHLLPNVLAVVVVTASLEMAQIILVEASLDYLGLGIRPPTPSLGNMLSDAQNYFTSSPLLVIAPGAVIFVLVLAATMLGNALRDAFDPRLHR